MNENKTSTLPQQLAGKFRKRPVVVEAVQLTRENAADVWGWVAPTVKAGMAVDVSVNIDTGLTISTLEGDMRAAFGWWVIKGVAGEFYPCEPAIFAATYEPAGDGPLEDAAARDEDEAHDEFMRDAASLDSDFTRGDQ